jgi:hypothetical protein
VEVCDGIDNDGDGLIDAADASLLLPLCENQVGVCNGVQKTSDLCQSGIWLTCAISNYASGSPGFEPTETSCDGLDNNCDGQVDEGGVCVPPATPTITGSTPLSPSDNSAPTLFGIATDGTTVSIYASNNCQGPPLAVTDPVSGGFFGQQVSVGLDTITVLTATATSTGGVVSGCSSSFTYVHDDTPPAIPAILSSDPISPGTSTTPTLSGTATPFSTVNIRTVSCLGTIVATGTAAGDGTFSIAVTVAANSSTTFYAQALDDVGNESGCSSAFTYTHTP